MQQYVRNIERERERELETQTHGCEEGEEVKWFVLYGSGSGAAACAFATAMPLRIREKVGVQMQWKHKVSIACMQNDASLFCKTKVMERVLPECGHDTEID